MARTGMDFNIKWETRLCEVDGEIGYFHTWEQWADVVEPSVMRGGHPGGRVSRVHGIVEFKNGVRRVDPYQIKFCDETNEILKDFNEMKRINGGKGYEKSPSYKDSVERSQKIIDEILKGEPNA